MKTVSTATSNLAVYDIASLAGRTLSMFERQTRVDEYLLMISRESKEEPGSSSKFEILNGVHVAPHNRFTNWLTNITLIVASPAK
jgi:hypothetical protein